MTAPPGVPPLTTSVAALCDELASMLPAHLSAQVRGIRDALRRPLRVALGGEISAGKSTLVNALLGRRMAEVGPGTTQRPTTVYRAAAADAPESVTLRLNDGTIINTGFGPDGTLLACTRPDVVHREVALHEPVLARLTLVDTPGLFSGDPTDTLSAAGERALLGAQDRATRDAMSAADALVYLLGDFVSAADETVLRRHGVGLAAFGKSGFNAVALIGRADQVQAGDRDPFTGAADQARAARTALGAAVADVVPVSGLLAETARTRALSDADIATLTALATSPPSDLVLDNATVLGRLPGMARPVGLLYPFGVRVALGHLAVHAQDRAGLEQLLERRSGIADVTALVEHRFLRHADVITSMAALRRLQALAARTGGPAGRAVADEVARVRMRADFHRVREAQLYQDVALRAVRLPEDLADEVGRLLVQHDVRERLGLAPDAEREVVAAELHRIRTRWAALRSDRRQALDARRAAPTVLETLRRLQDDAGVPARRITRDRHAGEGRHRRGGRP